MLLALDGQAHYSTAQIARKWTVTTDACSWTIANEGRWSSNPCIKRTSTDNTASPGGISKAPLMQQSGVWLPQASGVMGFAFKTEALVRHQGGNPSSGLFSTFVTWYEGSLAHLAAQINPDGTISVYRQVLSGDMTLLGTTPGALMIDNTWVYLEFKWTIGSVGSFSIRANGLEVFSFTGNTQSSVGGLGLWSSVRLLGMRSFSAPFLTCWLNDFYLCDTNGSGDALRDFLGDVRVHTIVPNGVGASTAWTPNTGANWDAVNEVPADDDTTYVSSNTAGQRDVYTYTDLPAGVTPLGFQTCLLGKRASAGSAAVAPAVRSGGTTVDATAQGIVSDTDYTYAFQPYDTNPVTGARATASEINAAEFGVLYV